MKFAIIEFPGTSCGKDTHRAIVQALGEEASIVPHTEETIEEFDAVILPGGTSYGDAVRPGAIAARQKIMAEVRKAADAGKPVIGIGNGFQILLEAGLLPGTLMINAGLKFICRPVELTVENAETMFTSGFGGNRTISMPIAHGKGQYYCDEVTLSELKRNNQILFTYAGTNPNGSISNIAGISNCTGNVLGMMPHPERAADALFGSTDGLEFFKSIVKQWRGLHAANA